MYSADHQCYYIVSSNPTKFNFNPLETRNEEVVEVREGGGEGGEVGEFGEGGGEVDEVMSDVVFERDNLEHTPTNKAKHPQIDLSGIVSPLDVPLPSIPGIAELLTATTTANSGRPQRERPATKNHAKGCGVKEVEVEGDVNFFILRVTHKSILLQRHIS